MKSPNTRVKLKDKMLNKYIEINVNIVIIVMIENLEGRMYLTGYLSDKIFIIDVLSKL